MRDPSGTCAATSAICTHTRRRPFSPACADIASSKSRAPTGSIVNVGRPVRSRRWLSVRSASRAARDASRSSSGSKPRLMPRSSSIASIMSRATSGRPITRITSAPVPRLARRTSTRSPARAPPADLGERPEPLPPITTREEPCPREGPGDERSDGNTRSAVRKRPPLASTATNAPFPAAEAGGPERLTWLWLWRRRSRAPPAGRVRCPRRLRP